MKYDTVRRKGAYDHKSDYGMLHGCCLLHQLGQAVADDFHSVGDIDDATISSQTK
ncbi:MAG: hypothetical protein AAB638_00185 [Patescibacteria group bacterium]